MTQEQALSILQTGANVFLTGEPGAGKTYTINRYVAWLRERGVEPAITASTGIAATHIGGMTIHAWSGIGIKHELSDWDLEALLEREPLVRRTNAAKVLILDEVSMLDARMLTMVERALRTLRRSDAPFGGLQVIFVGDFFQLPPVNKTAEGAQFAFESPAWAAARPLTCYLSEQHRQSDDAFLGILSALRAGTMTAAHTESLRARADASGADATVTRLYPHNADVDRLNEEALGKLPQGERLYRMQTQGGKALVEALKRGCLSPEELRVKEGATVMFTRNNFDTGYVNGTLGTVTAFSADGYPLVKTRAGKVIEALPEEWRIEDGKRILAKISQVPLRLAWAMTVHKSQGMSLDAAVMDLSQAFEYGQGYVALSRVRTLSGLYLLGFNAQALRVHPEVLQKDEDFRIASEDAQDVFAKLPPEELALMHAKFIKAIGGKDPAEVAAEKAKVEPGKLEKLRAKHPNAYRPWSEEDDAMLRAMFESDTAVSELQKTFGRQRGAIRARLMKLGLIEEEA